MEVIVPDHNRHYSALQILLELCDFDVHHERKRPCTPNRVQ